LLTEVQKHILMANNEPRPSSLPDLHSIPFTLSHVYTKKHTMKFYINLL